jgi:hypothetical protein
VLSDSRCRLRDLENRIVKDEVHISISLSFGRTSPLPTRSSLRKMNTSLKN